MHASPRDELSTREWLEGKLARLLGGLPGAWLLKAIGEAPVQIDGQTLDPHIQFIIAARRSQSPALLCGPTPAAGRARLRREVCAVAASSGVRPTRMHAVTAHTVDGADGPLAARLYTPRAATSDRPQPLLLFCHGGGFVIGDLDTHDEPCRVLSHHTGMPVLSVAYRLAPEHPFPAGLHDVIAAVRWATRHASSLGAAATPICVAGDSAGACLATSAALELANDPARPLAQLLLYPATDLASATPSRTALFSRGFILTADDIDAFLALYLNDNQATATTPLASPARRADLAAAPPATIVTAGFDPIRDEGEAYASALQQAGVPVRFKRFPSLVHGFLHLTTVAPGAQSALVEAARMFRSQVDSLSRPR